jgi:hypothetical protein
MQTFSDLAENTDNSNFKEIYKIIAEKYLSKGVQDSLGDVSFTNDELNYIQQLQYEQVKANYVSDGISFLGLDDLKKHLIIDIQKKLNKVGRSIEKETAAYVKDGFYNPITNIGTLNDPGQYNQAFSPVSMSPAEATSYYSSRGIGSLIIDKKSKVPLLNGFRFVGDLEEDDLNSLLDHAKKLNFDKFIISGIRDGLIYGGASIVPVFNADDNSKGTYQLTYKELLKQKILDKDSINYFMTVDRWNMVVIPNYNLTAKDYLNPDHFFIPFGSMKVSSERASLIKPYPQPYWSAIRQLGWSSSDFEGYIRQLLGYNIIAASIPIMAQQMSLLIHEFPLDGVLAQNGADFAKEFIKLNESQLRDWSMLNPKAINSAGKISVIERAYTGFREIIATYREDIAANCDLPVSNLFYLQAKGMSADNEQDTTLKQSESIKKIETEITPQLKNLIRILVIDCFGSNSEQAKKANDVNIDFSNPVVMGNGELAEVGLKFSQFIGQMTSAQMPLDLAIKQARQFFPDYEIDESELERLQMPSEGQEPDQMFGKLNSNDNSGFFNNIFKGFKR